MKKIIFVLIAICFIVLGITIARDVNTSNQVLKIKTIELKNNEVKLKKLEADFNALNSQKANDEKQVKELEQQRLKLEEEKKNLEAQLQAKAELKKQQGAVVYAAAGEKNCGDNFYKQFIYQHESGCRTDAVNSIGCRGIGQACPGSKLPCGNDFACQDTWFSNYAIKRYGSWEAAYNFWVKNRWW